MIKLFINPFLYFYVILFIIPGILPNFLYMERSIGESFAANTDAFEYTVASQLVQHKGRIFKMLN